MLAKSRRSNLRHIFIASAQPLASMKPQRERERVSTSSVVAGERVSSRSAITLTWGESWGEVPRFNILAASRKIRARLVKL